MASFCTQCGQAIRDGASFCGGCGTALQSQEQNSPIKPAVAPRPAINPVTASPAIVAAAYPRATTAQPIAPTKSSPMRSLAIWAGLIVLGICVKLGISTATASYKLNQQESHAASTMSALGSELHKFQPGDS